MMALLTFTQFVFTFQQQLTTQLGQNKCVCLLQLILDKGRELKRLFLVHVAVDEAFSVHSRHDVGYEASETVNRNH